MRNGHPLTRRLPRVLPVALGLCLSVIPALSLDSTQQATLNTANSALNSALGDLHAAKGSAGSVASPATGSRLKLTEMRLSSGKEKLAQAAELLGTLPAGDPAVAPLQKQFDALQETVVRIETILRGKPANAPPLAGSAPAISTTQAAPVAAPPAGQRLDYKQEKTLKDAEWHWREAAGCVENANKFIGKLDGDGPKPVVAELASALASIENGIKKHTLAVDYIKQLPAAHPDVAALAADIKSAGDALSAHQTRLQGEHAKLAKFTDMASYPAFETDLTLVGDLAVRYADFANTVQRPQTLAAVIAEDAQALATIEAIAKTYLPLVEQSTEAGLRMDKRVGYFRSQRQSFMASAMEHKAALPAIIDKDITQVLEIARKAVEEKRPLFFGEDGGVAQALGFAEERIQLLKAFDEAAAKPYVDKLDQTREQVKAQAKNLEADIIANNPLPPDRYKGADRDALIKQATDTWDAEQKGAKVLAVRIPSENWERDTRWRWSADAFHKIDTSKLQVQLLIKHDNEQAVVRAIDLYKNHLEGDRITAQPFEKADAELQPWQFVRLDKIK